MLSKIQPISRAAPALNGNLAARQIGTIPAASIPIFIHGQTLDEILQFGDQHPGREVGSFLLGQYCRDEREFVLIDSMLPASHTIGHFSSLTFTHNTWSHLQRHLESQKEPRRLVGWHHTHPGLGVSLSRYDRFIHNSFFDQPWHVALVVDTHNHQLAFYQGNPELLNVGFLIVPTAKMAKGLDRNRSQHLKIRRGETAGKHGNLATSITSQSGNGQER